MSIIDRWEKIVGLPDYYECRRDGSVRSVDHIRNAGCGRVATSRGRILKPYALPSGHLYFNYSDGGKVGRVYVHRAIASAFLPNPNNLPSVNHKDGNPRNNRVENLEWVTQKQNAVHSWYVLGRQKNKTFPGEAHYKHKLTDEAVRFIRRNSGQFTNRQFADMFGVTEWPISIVLEGKGWTHVA